MRRGPALLLTIALGLGAVLAVAGPASAHNQIVASTPSPNETLTALPARFAIDTNNVLLDIGGTGRGFAFEIRGPDGKFYEDGCVSIVDDNMFTTGRLGAQGKYTIIFQIVSADGHSVSGTIPFTWAPAPASTAVVTTGVSSPPGCNGGPAPGKPHTDATSTQTTRTSTVPIADVLWIGGVIVVVAIAVIVTLVVLTRRRRDEPDDRDDRDAPEKAG